MTKLIPFGEYKGQEIDQIIEDRSYTEWLCAQSWFRERHGDLYKIIINNFSEPEDTPEHNKLQARFLDKEYCYRFASKILGIKYKESEKNRISVVFEQGGFDVFIEGLVEYEPTKEELEKEQFCIDSGDQKEPKKMWYKTFELIVEVKPILSDDYPTVLRKIGVETIRLRRYDRTRYVVFVGEFNSEAVTYDQLVKIFACSHVAVIRTADI